MNRRTCVLLALVIGAPRVLAGQNDSVPVRHDGTRAIVHWGKWLVAGVAVTFTALGAHEHANSNREWGALLALCRADNADCVLGPDGRYLNPAAEQLYQSSLEFDRRARARLLAGQGALLAAAALFIADLRRHAGGPGNKPFSPLELSPDPSGRGARVGLRVHF
jgi:hypothetical protein